MDRDRTRTRFIDVADGTNANFWYPPTNEVVLDEGLKDYPAALRYVLEHEHDHARIGPSFWRQLVFEFKNDWFLAFSRSWKAEEYRRYARESSPDLSVGEWVAYAGPSLLRVVYAAPVYLAGSVYRRFYKVVEGWL